MLAPERHGHILKELARHEAMRIGELANALGVSEMTVRRDIDALDAAGLAQRVHGGVMRRAALSAQEPGFGTNVDRERGAKTAIGRAARRLVKPGMTIALTGGTTTFALAAALADVEALTVVTNSLKVADLLHRNGPAGGTVLLTGGQRTPSEALVGPLACASLALLNTDLCFLGVHGIDAQRGLSTPNLAEADTNAAFAHGTRSLVVLADHTKFNVRALATIAGLDAVDAIITDDGVSAAVRETFSALVATFETAPTGPRQSRMSP